MEKRQKIAQRHTPMGVALRTETRRELVARLLIMSWSIERIARRLGMSTKSIHRIIGTPEFERIYQDLQQQQLKHVDRRLGHLFLNDAVRCSSGSCRLDSLNRKKMTLSRVITGRMAGSFPKSTTPRRVPDRPW